MFQELLNYEAILFIRKLKNHHLSTPRAELENQRQSLLVFRPLLRLPQDVRMDKLD